MPDFQSATVNLENKANSKSAKDSKIQSVSTQMKRNNLDGIIQRARSNPGSLTVKDVMQLQNAVGNKAVYQLFSNSDEKNLLRTPGQAATQPVQMQEGHPEEEEEPMQAAIQPVQMQEGHPEEEEEPMQAAIQPVQMEEGHPEEEEEPAQAAIQPLQMQEGHPGEEEEPLQGKGLHSGGMPEEVQAKMEGAFKTDFSDVKIHADSGKATEVGALAYTQGSDIHFAPGQYHPSDQSGQALLGHELTHVVQQREGRVQPTTQMAGLPVNDDEGLESEADSFGASAASFKLS